MDIKIEGLAYDIMEQALKQARDGRLHILEKLTDTIAEPNKQVKAHALRSSSLKFLKNTSALL